MKPYGERVLRLPHGAGCGSCSEYGDRGMKGCKAQKARARQRVPAAVAEQLEPAMLSCSEGLIWGQGCGECLECSLRQSPDWASNLLDCDDMKDLDVFLRAAAQAVLIR